ncbi:hypothetical protein AVEN_221743-1 [Araneus ventricosus]|uniref:Uncharacterized protein n=1 Tax=Araneus ventricosus TaxID=182803 RepID=A0A4Y2C380_ARAVE|nr:hypothetical protein AVEN_221743-1 [Araneus ventricosus]
MNAKEEKYIIPKRRIGIRKDEKTKALHSETSDDSISNAKTKRSAECKMSLFLRDYALLQRNPDSRTNREWMVWRAQPRWGCPHFDPRMNAFLRFLLSLHTILL